MKFQNEKKELWRYASKNLEAPVRGTSKQPPLPHHLPPQRLPQPQERPMTTQSSQLALLGCYGGYGENSISTATIFGEEIVCTPPPPYSSVSELDCSNSVTIPDYTLTLRKHPAYHKEKGIETSLSATESDMGYNRKIVAISRDGCSFANTGDIMYADDHNKLNETSASSSSQLTIELQMKTRQSSPHSTIRPQSNQQMASTATIAAAPTATITTSTTSFAATAAKILRNCCGGTFGSSNSFAIPPPTNSCTNNNTSCNNKTIYHHPKNGVVAHTANSCNFPPEQHFNTLMKQLKASQISSLLKAVKSRHDQIIPMPTPVSNSSNASSSSSLRYSNHLTNCILVRRAEILGEEPYVIAYRLFFWRDLKNASQIKRLPVCPNERDPVYVCCNPLHWCRILDTESTSTPCLHQTMKRYEGENSANDVNSSTGREKFGKNFTDVQRLASESVSDSVTTDGEDRRSSSNWCEVAYWEMGKRVGERYLADTPAINIFSDKSYTTCGDLKDGMCLRDLVEKSTTFSPDDVQHTRQKIGLGVTLSQEWDGVWLYNRSTVPVFLYSPTLTESWFRVCRVEPGDCLKAFDKYKANSLIYPSQFPGVQAGPIDKFSMCISFGKGWGYSYKRPNITLCPCWLEVFFKPQR